MPVTIYTRTTCAPCQMVKQFFQRKGVEYKEVNVDDDPSAIKDIIEATGLMIVPTTFIGDNVIQGMNFGRLVRALEK